MCMEYIVMSMAVSNDGTLAAPSYAMAHLHCAMLCSGAGRFEAASAHTLRTCGGGGRGGESWDSGADPKAGRAVPKRHGHHFFKGPRADRHTK